MVAKTAAAACEEERFIQQKDRVVGNERASDGVDDFEEAVAPKATRWNAEVARVHDLPGCFDGIVARMAARKGFPALYLSGGGTSALTGVPDIGIVDSKDFCSKIQKFIKVFRLASSIRRCKLKELRTLGWNPISH